VASPGSCATGAAACIAAELARAFALGQLAPAERATIEHRIAACARCRAAVAEAVRTSGGPLAADLHGATAVQRPRRASPTPAPHAPPVTLPLRRGHDARDDEVIELIGGRPAATAPDRPGAHRDPRNAPALPSTPDGGLVPGEVVGRYVVERPLGAGGMGVVSLARDPELRRPVVIKLVHPNMGHGEGGDELEARLRREAQAMAQVSHANVVQIFDIGRRGDRVFLAMEFISGRTFDVWLLEQPRSADEILAMIRQAGAGLAAAHRAGLVHRDFKPTNVLVGNDGIVKVTDFGLARAVQPAGGSASALSAAGATRQLRVAQVEPVRGDGPTMAAPFAPRPRPSGVHAVLTEVDSVVGTPAYMAPEQSAGRALDARTDQYALAVTLLDALLGQSPSRRRVLPGAPASAIDHALDDAGIGSRVRDAIVRALAEDPAARFPAIDDLLRALAPPAPRRSRRAVLVGVGVAVCGLAAAVWLVLSDDAAADCAASAPGRWAGGPRARVVAALGAVPRPFAAWDAERIAVAVDRAVETLGAAEIARCRGTPLAGGAETSGSAASVGGPACIPRRTTALSAAIAQLSSAPPPDDPWPLVRAIEQCDAPADPASGALRTELRTATAARARVIADAARKAGNDRLVADALEAAGLAALAASDPASAESDLRAMTAAGERAGDDASRGRALLHLVEAARWRGEYSDARRDLDDLHAMMARHGNAPRDELAVALVEAAAASDLGDVAAAFAAWDRARDAARSLDQRDGELAASIGRAWSTHVLRFDLAGARTEATAALAAGTGATPAARAAGLVIAADLAIAARDGDAALTALAEAQRLVPSRTALAADRIRLQRARALAGDAASGDGVDRILADLPAAGSDDPLTTARIEIARGRILLAANRPGEAREALEKVERDVRSRGRTVAAVPMAVPEHIDLELAVCEAQLATSDRCKASYQLDNLLKPLHPRAPVRARLAIALAGSDAIRELTSLRSQYLLGALDILVDAGAEPLQVAALRWQVAQLGAGGADRRRLATAARETFQAHGRTAEVAAIDAWLGRGSDGAAPPPVDAGAPRDRSRPRDPWGPQP
jgi:tetratricopeptide (TPR) repeat protein